MVHPHLNLQLSTIINENILAYKPDYQAKNIKNLFVEARILLNWKRTKIK